VRRGKKFIELGT